MLKRSLMIVTLLSGIVPMAAIAGNVSTRVMTAGGTATMGSGAAQNSASGTVTKFFGTGAYYNTSGKLISQVDAGTTVAFAPATAAGYVVSEVKLNGVVQTVLVGGVAQPIASPVTVPAASKGQSVTIKFARQTVSVTANAAAGGSVIPGGTKSGIVGTPLTYVFTPFAGAKVQSIAGLPSGAVLKNTAAIPATVTLPYAGPVAVTFTPVAGTNVTMTPVFLAITASAGSAQSVATGATVTLGATASVAGSTFAWTQVAGPTLLVGTSPWTAGIAAPTVTLAATAASYTFQVIATSPAGDVSAPAAVVVTATVGGPAAVPPNQLAKNQCENCHSAQGVGAGIFTKYSSSIHGQSTHSTCSACHVGTLTGSHPGTVNYGTVSKTTFATTAAGVNGLATGALMCNTCHASSVTATHGIPHAVTGLGTGVTCSSCHTGTNGTNGTGDAHQIQNVTTLSGLTDTLCVSCHSQATTGNATGSIVTGYNASIHKAGAAYGSNCAGCHGGSHDSTIHPSKLNVDPTTFKTTTAGVTLNGEGTPVTLALGQVYCTACHTGAYPIPHPTTLLAGVSCAKCHTDATGANAGTGDAHNITALPKCVECHAVQQAQVASTLVNDNNGVRAILGANSEFAKKSHHIFNGVGVAPTDAQCVACHLEGSVVTSYGVSSINVDSKVHMVDAKIHLRNSHNDTDFAWDPQAATSTDHSNMDNFCMSCHSATGADSDMSKLIQGYLNANKAFVGAPAATPTNPFGDLLSNSYDKQSRVNVVDVNSQFNTGNYSHHAVKGKRYTTRTSTVAVAAWVAYSTSGGHSTDAARPAGSFNATTQKTLYDGKLLGSTDGGVSAANGTLYTPLDTTKSGARIGDDSQLHCGDCHTVGQWKVGSSTNADGTATTAAIGAHGSANEYMLRNSKGTDALHGLGTFICYNCHNDKAGGNTSGGYYATAYWNNATGKWVSGGNQHLNGIHQSGASTQYGGSSGCVGTTAGLTFTGYTSATHNTVSWAASFAVTSATNAFADLTGDSTFTVTTQPYGAQYVTFDASGNIQMAYTVGAPNGAVGNYFAGGSGNGISGAYDADGTPTSGWTGTGRNNFVVGNILGIGCMNCHNAGRDANGGGFGGIHGGSFTYTTGYSADKHGAGTGALNPVGETQSTYRFMPGNGNYGYAPIGSNIVVGTSTNGTRAVSGKAAWEAWNGVGTSNNGGCYTNDYANQNAGWSGCNHHGNAGQVPHNGTAFAAPNMSGGDLPTKSATMGNVGRTLNY